ncbi:hypothetical protein BBJ28_00008756 [Nothophytophthora sp. Chile5]|nr:hypothetical protein BBJ28_00008756 [Nothophytophthora sp. Chile5]
MAASVTSRGEGEPSSVGTSAPAVTPASDLQVEISSYPPMLLSSSDLSQEPQTNAVNLENCSAELLQWLGRSPRGSSAPDDALFFLQTRYPELLDDLPLLFAWLSLFLAQHASATAQPSTVVGPALLRLEGSGDLAAVAAEFSLQSPVTLLFWKHEVDAQLLPGPPAAPTASETPAKVGGRARTSFQDEAELAQWVLARRQTALTKQDVLSHVLSAYPAFAASKTPAALKIWTSRFLQRHVGASAAAPRPATELQQPGDDVQDHTPPVTEAAEAPAPLELPKRRQKRPKPASSEGSRVFSNEFKLQALRQLDEGKSVTEVAEQLGLKTSHSLAYWRRIREKLATAEKKRFRLAGGGRRSSCGFEDELLTWAVALLLMAVCVSVLGGTGTDVKAVLDYMRQRHAAFTDGKKEATLRKWILRFFKRCWRAPSTSTDSQDADKSYIFRSHKPTRRSRPRKAKTSDVLEPLPQNASSSAELLGRLLLTQRFVPQRRGANVCSASPAKSPSGNNSGLTGGKQPPQPSNGVNERVAGLPADPSGLLAFERSTNRWTSLEANRTIRPEEDVVYLVLCETPPCGFRNVYWLRFVDEGCVVGPAAPLEYVTLSCHGFTRFQGGEGTEFSDLASWVDEKRAFDHIASMPGLERIQQMLFFFSWKRQTVKRRRRRMQARLACSLFVCHPLAARLLLQVRLVCAEIESEAAREYATPQTSYSLQQLAQLHGERLRVARAAVVAKIQALCATIDEATRELPRYREGDSSYAVTSLEDFSASLVTASLRERMFAFLRLVDCHVAEAVFQHLELVVLGLHSQICGLSERSSKGEEAEQEGVAYLLGGPEQQRVSYRTRSRGVAVFPALYIQLMETVDLEGDVASATLAVAPTKEEVLELVHDILTDYCVALDDLPPVLSDARFQHVLTPFVPSMRREFGEKLLRASHLVLQSHERELRRMRDALDVAFRQLDGLQQEHLRCIRAIRMVEREARVDCTAAIDEEEEEGEQRLPELPDSSSSAAAYELAQRTWGRLAEYANTAAPMLQTGFLLLDQRSLVAKLRSHVSKRVAEMNDALPTIYQQFLASLLDDVDGRIESVTKIPTTLADANAWLVQVTSMMATHPFRQRLDAKCANLARLRALLKDRGVLLDAELQDAIRKLELAWESVFETLLLCLTRVQDRDSEHRRSLQDVLAKAEEHVASQLQHIIKIYDQLPIDSEEESQAAAREFASRTDDLVQRLEELVEMDLERRGVAQRFTAYDREQRVLLELPPVLSSTRSSVGLSGDSSSLLGLSERLPSELLLQYLVTALEMRQWFRSWRKLREKWLESSLTSVHPGAMINRIKQFRRRLAYASTRLSRLASVLLQTLPLEPIEPRQKDRSYGEQEAEEQASFPSQDLLLLSRFDASIEEMLGYTRIFQAVSGGAFTEERWTAMHHLLGSENWQSVPSDSARHVTLRVLRENCGGEQLDALLELCDQCIVEAKLHVKLEQARQRLARLQVRVCETNFSVRCEGVAEALAQLDEIEVDVKLCLFGQNPELQQCLAVCAELERKVAVCEHILSYQKHWRLGCEVTKLHDVDEFFCKRLSDADASPAGSQERWRAFLDASHAWSDRLRRLFFVNPTTNPSETPGSSQRADPGLQPRGNTATKTVDCSLDGVLLGFEGFEFESALAACESGMDLIRAYLDSLRGKAPRLFCLDEVTLLQLLLRDADASQLHRALATCFPRVHRFVVTRSTTLELAASSASVRGSSTDGTIVILGVEGMQSGSEKLEKGGSFHLPVAKIGRITFWFTRLEEEMAAMVRMDLKRAFDWVLNDDSELQATALEELLPQSIATACGLHFTLEMTRVLQVEQQQRLLQLRDTVSNRLTGLVASRQANRAATANVRVENLLLLTARHSEVLGHLVELFQQDQTEEALFFWSLQFQTRVYLEAASASTNTSSSAVAAALKAGGNRAERTEMLLPTADLVAGGTGQAMELAVYSQIAHLQLPLGQEFVGWTRLAVLSPFTQRCCYALFSAMKMHRAALSVPFSTQQGGMEGGSLVSDVANMLLRPWIEFSCCSSAGIATTRHLTSLMNAASGLNGFLVVRHLLQLSPALVRSFQEQLLQRFHQTEGHSLQHHQPRVSMASLVLPRQPGGAFAIFIPLDSRRDLQRSGLLQSIRTHFRAIAVVQPTVRYVAKCLLLADGFTMTQIQQMNVISAFEALAAMEFQARRAFDVLRLVPRVIQEARRLREVNRVVWGTRRSSSAGRSTFGLMKTPTIDEREAQTVFRLAFASIFEPLLAGKQEEDAISLQSLLTRVFPLSAGGRLVAKAKRSDEAVASAVDIYLENAYATSAGSQRELILDLYRALQVFPAALVYGPPGSGKSTCITALHRALVALQLSELSEEDAPPPSKIPQLVVLNPRLLTLDQFYGSVATACGPGSARPQRSALRWVLVDGELDGAVLERLLGTEGDARSCASALPSSSLLYRTHNSSVLLTADESRRDSPRLLFELTNLASLSPSALGSCWALRVPDTWISYTSVISAWRSRWEKQLQFPVETRGFEALTLVFRTVETLISSVCIRFIVEEAAQDDAVDGEQAMAVEGAPLRLGCLSLNHLTQTALTLVALCCFQQKALLLELPSPRIMELVAFAVLWGFAGHLPEPLKHKLEHFLRVKCKGEGDTKHLSELPGSLLDATHFEELWDELQPTLTPSTATNRATSELQSALDVSSGQILVLPPAASSVVRLCSLLLHSSRSFLLVGPAASGKTSLLRWLVRQNEEEQTAEMKIETSLDHGQAHGILDWMEKPPAWFRPLPLGSNDVESRAKMKEETQLFGGNPTQSFVFLDDVDAGGRSGDEAQCEFIRTMLDHRLGFSSKRGGFQPLSKRVGAAMRQDDSDSAGEGCSSSLTRLLRHFAVFRTPTYTPKELLSVFRVKFQRGFPSEGIQSNIQGGGDRRLPLEEVVLRASMDFAVETLALRQSPLGLEHPGLLVFNLHVVSLLLERTLAFTADLLAASRRGVDSAASSDGTTLVMLGRVHQSWLSELQNLFLSQWPPPDSRSKATEGASKSEEVPKKLWGTLRYLSEKYFSVALRTGSNDLALPVPVEAVHFLVHLASRHVQAPLLQPHLAQLRGLLSSYATVAGGGSRRASDHSERRSFNAGNWAAEPVRLVTEVLLELAAASGPRSSGDDNRARRYATGQLTELETRLVLSSSWCLTQTLHLVHALDQQQIMILSTSSRYGRPLAERLLRVACDLHGFNVYVVTADGKSEEARQAQHEAVLRLALNSAGVRQERVALWLHRRQLEDSERNCLRDVVQELCLCKLPSLTLLAGGEELRDALVLSCIQARRQLDLVTETELLTEFQQRLQRNLRLCIFEEADDSADDGMSSRPTVLDLLKTRQCCHWRCLALRTRDVSRLLPEMARTALTSSALCAVAWDSQLLSRYVALCESVHAQMLLMSSVPAEPATQMTWFLSFLSNLIVTYREMTQRHATRLLRLESGLEALAFAETKVVPTLRRQRLQLEEQCAQLDRSLELVVKQREEGVAAVRDSELQLSVEQDEAAWALRARYEELAIRTCETRLRLQQSMSFLTEWQLVAARASELGAKWTRELAQEKSKDDRRLMGAAVFASAHRAYPQATTLSSQDREACRRVLLDRILEAVNAEGEAATLEGLEEEEEDSVDLVRLLWTARFPFLRNEELFRTVRLVDALCDRVPVVEDPSGVFQRFFVHFFSGHTLFSSLPGCGAGGDDENGSSSNTKAAVVLACEDPTLERQLHEAQRLAVPVLLVNFHSSDHRLLSRLQPFLEHPRLSHASPRRPMLRELTIEAFEQQWKQKRRRSSLVTSTAALTGKGIAAITRRAMKPQSRNHHAVTLDATAISRLQDLGELSDRRGVQVARSDSTDNQSITSGFQVYAVTATPTSAHTQHALAAQFAFFSMTLPTPELEEFFQDSDVDWGHHSPSILAQELLDEQVAVAGCSSKLRQSRIQLWHLVDTLRPVAIDPHASPFAFETKTLRSGTATLQQQDSYSRLALQLAQEQQDELTWRSHDRRLQAKRKEMADAAKAFAPTARRLAGVARCMTAMASLTLGDGSASFYSPNYRWLASAVSQQLAAQDESKGQEQDGWTAAVLDRVLAGFASESQSLLFRLLAAIQQQAQAIKEPSPRAWGQAMTLLSSNSAANGLPPETSDAGDGAVLPAREHASKWRTIADTTFVERLRRRVRLCAYLFNGWRSSSPGNAHPSHLLEKNAVPERRTSSPPPQTHGSAAGNAKTRDMAVAQLQEQFDGLLATAEALWYQWKTAKAQQHSDMERLVNGLCLVSTPTAVPTERSGVFPSAKTLLSLEEVCTSWGLISPSLTASDRTQAGYEGLARLLLAKTYFPAQFADALEQYLRRPNASRPEDKNLQDQENCEADKGGPPPGLAADVAPSRGRHMRAHLPRALLVYPSAGRNAMALKLAAWEVVVFSDVDTEHSGVCERLTALITTKSRFVLELLGPELAESALALVSRLLNEHALLSIPEWYMLASLRVATAIQNGKLPVMERRVVLSSRDTWRIGSSDSGDGFLRTLKHKLVEQCGISELAASKLMLTVVAQDRDGDQEEDRGLARVLQDLVRHCSAIEDVAAPDVDRERMHRNLLRLLAERADDHDGGEEPAQAQDEATRAAVCSSELLSDLLSLNPPVKQLIVGGGGDAGGAWPPRHSVNAGEAACDRVWETFRQLRGLLKMLEEVTGQQDVDGNTAMPFFPWRSLDDELVAQLATFQALEDRLALLRSPASAQTIHGQGRRQQLASLARGNLPFEWAQRFFAGAPWPSPASASLAVAQVVLLVACRAGVLVRCLRGDRAWALNLAVVSDACGFLRGLRTHAAQQVGLPESAMLLVLETDAFLDQSGATDAKAGDDHETQSGKAGASSGGDDWHGAVLRHADPATGVVAWGIRVDGLVLVEQVGSTSGATSSDSAIRTTLHPLPTCRFLCLPSLEQKPMGEDAPVLLLPSLSLHQPTPMLLGSAAVRVALGHSLDSVVALKTANCETRFAVGVPVFPDDDSHDAS